METNTAEELALMFCPFTFCHHTGFKFGYDRVFLVLGLFFGKCVQFSGPRFARSVLCPIFGTCVQFSVPRLRQVRVFSSRCPGRRGPVFGTSVQFSVPRFARSHFAFTQVSSSATNRLCSVLSLFFGKQPGSVLGDPGSL